MARENLYWDLVHAAEVAETEAERILLNDAAFEVGRLSDLVDDLEERRNRIEVSVTLSADRIHEILEGAFVNVIGKDLEYVMEAVREKMDREGDTFGEQEQNSQDSE